MNFKTIRAVVMLILKDAYWRNVHEGVISFIEEKSVKKKWNLKGDDLLIDFCFFNKKEISEEFFNIQ